MISLCISHIRVQYTLKLLKKKKLQLFIHFYLAAASVGPHDIGLQWMQYVYHTVPMLDPFSAAETGDGKQPAKKFSQKVDVILLTMTQ